jgi:hypothetical protein
MKAVVLVFLLAVLAAAMVGCENVTAYYDEDAQQIVTADQWQAMTPDEQAKYEPVEVQQIRPEVAAKVDAGLQTAETGLKIVKPFVPEPFASLGGLVLGGLIAVWQIVKAKKIRGQLDAVSLGATITAETVEKVVKPSAQLWEAFKREQEAKAANTKAAMPHSVIALT